MQNYSYRRILWMTAPLMLGTFVQSIVTITDGIFVSQLGSVEVGAFGNGSLLYYAFFMLCRGLADGTQITVARHNGAGHFPEIGKTLKAAQTFQLIMSGTLVIAFLFVGELLILSFTDPSAVTTALTDFINVRLWGLIFAAQHITLVGFFIGLGRTPVILTSAVIIAVCNILLDYLLINGNWGFPAYGLVGAPLASSISEFVGFLFLFLFLVKKPDFKQYKYRLMQGTLRLREHLSLLKLSYPLMLQGVLSLSTWLVFFTKVEGMGLNALETSHNIRYMYFLAFVPLFGFAASTKTIISNLVGQNKAHLIPKIQNRIILLSVTFMILFFHGALLYPDKLIGLINLNPDITTTAFNDSVYILRFVSGSILIYAVAIVLYNTISGLGKSTIYFGIECVAILLYLLCCYLFIDLWHWPIRFVWWVEYFYFLTFGILSLGYFLYYRKKHLMNG